VTVFLAAVFGLCLGLCFWVYFGYPAFIWVLARVRPRPVRRAEVRPHVTVILPVYNEEAVIEEKVCNTLSLDYPRDLLEVLVVSDGSTDATEEIVSRFEGKGVRLLSLPRQGKVLALNEAVREARGEVLVFTDATVTLEPDSVARLVENFADPEVGGVCGNQVYRSSREADATAGGETMYWSYDKWLKAQESRTGSIFASDGSLHAVRRDLYVPIEEPAQADDIAISARVVLQGRRLVFEPRALAWEAPPEEAGGEFRRKVRVTNHSMRALLELGSGLWRTGLYSLELVSHKLLRHLVPFFLLGMLGAGALLAPFHLPFLVLLGLQLLFYLLAGLGWLLRGKAAGRFKILLVPYYFTLANAAALVGVLSLLRGERIRTWQPRGGAEGIE